MGRPGALGDRALAVAEGAAAGGAESAPARASVRSCECRRAWLLARVGRCLREHLEAGARLGLRSVRKSRELKACRSECAFWCPGA